MRAGKDKVGNGEGRLYVLKVVREGYTEYWRNWSKDLMEVRELVLYNGGRVF